MSRGDGITAPSPTSSSWADSETGARLRTHPQDNADKQVERDKQNELQNTGGRQSRPASDDPVELFPNRADLPGSRERAVSCERSSSPAAFQPVQPGVRRPGGASVRADPGPQPGQSVGHRVLPDRRILDRQQQHRDVDTLQRRSHDRRDDRAFTGRHHSTAGRRHRAGQSSTATQQDFWSTARRRPSSSPPRMGRSRAGTAGR